VEEEVAAPVTAEVVKEKPVKPKRTKKSTSKRTKRKK
jgi:hypothetical protein